MTVTSRSLWTANAAEAIEGGMSGSPIVDEVGKALGVVCISAEFKTAEGREMGKPREGGPNPLLTACLPGWLFPPSARDSTAGTVAGPAC